MTPADVRVEREHGATLDGALDALLAAEPTLAYANFPPIGERAPALHRRWWHAASAALVARDAGGQPLAALRHDRRAFESQHFGIPMAKIDPPLAVADEARRLPALRTLYRAAFDDLRANGIAHVAASAATQDRVAGWVLQELRAFHVGTRISWMAPLTGTRRGTGLPSPLRIEMHERDAIARLDPASWRRLDAWTATAFDRGPFVFDLAVAAERAGAVYQTWTRKALTGEWADVVLTVVDGAEVVGFHAMLLMPDLSEAAGVGVIGRGIGASLPGYRGLFAALQTECDAVRPLGAGFLEDETQAATLPTINVFGKLGHFCHRSVATFHRRFDAPSAEA